MFAQLKAYGWMVCTICLAGLLAGQTWRLHTAQLARADAVVALSNERAIAAGLLATSQGETRAVEQKLQDQASDGRKELREAEITTGLRVGDLLQRVRLAEARAATAALVSQATSAPSTGAAAPIGDGAELLGTLGSEDVAEASRAETIRLHLASCYRQYNEARDASMK